MKYTRIYVDGDGGSRFADVAPDLRPATASWSTIQAEHAPPMTAGEVYFRRLVGAAAAPDDPHVAPRRQLLVSLAGETEVETSDGEVRRLVPGSVLLVEDTEGKGHRTRVLSDDVQVLVVTLADA